jgi:hypothetical protein
VGAGGGLPDERRTHGLRSLPGRLASGFRGVPSFWTASELSDEALALAAREIAERLLLGLAERRRSIGSGSWAASSPPRPQWTVGAFSGIRAASPC